MCRFLAHAAMRFGRSAALLDTDVGQKMVGPPACVTLVQGAQERLLFCAPDDGPGDPHNLSLAFVGTTDPVLGWRRLIEGTRRLARQAEADLLVVNTSGLLAGPGRRLKAAKIRELQPDLVIGLGGEPLLETITGDGSVLPMLRLPSSPEARRKTDGERRAARREAFRLYFARATMLGLAQAMLQSTGSDAPLPAGLLLGLADEAGGHLGLGLLVGCSGGTLEILSPVAGSHIRQITAGFLCLDKNFAEAPVPTRPQGG